MNTDQSTIIPFVYEDSLVRVIRDEENNPWFVAKDVCTILEIYDVSQAVENLDDDEKLIRVLHVSGQSREVWTLSEPGLYTLIIRSNKQAAKPFRRWITHEVIPSIRKTGKYEIPPAVPATASSISAATLAQMSEGHRGLKLSARIQIMNIVCQIARIDGEPHTSDDIYLKYADLCRSMRNGSEPSRIDGVGIQAELARFFESDCIFGGDLSVSKPDLYAAYRSFANEEGIPAQPDNIFFRTLHGYAPVREYHRRSMDSGRVRYLRGVSLSVSEEGRADR